jgi:hypothetical protein
MALEPQRVVRPIGTVQAPVKKRGWFAVNRNYFTLTLSVLAIVFSLVSAGVNVYIFWNGGQAKTVNEANQILVQAEVNKVLREVNAHPDSHPELTAELSKMYKDVLYRPPSDTILTFYERMAFATAVGIYATPMTNIQLQLAQARLHASERGTVDLKTESRCFVDPYLSGCPSTAETQPATAKQVQH